MIDGHGCYQGSYQELLSFIIYAHILAYFLGDFKRKTEDS